MDISCNEDCCLANIYHFEETKHCRCCFSYPSHLNRSQNPPRPPPLDIPPIERTPGRRDPLLPLMERYKSQNVVIGRLTPESKPLVVKKNFKFKLNIDLNKCLKDTLCTTITKGTEHSKVVICYFAHSFMEIKECAKHCTKVRCVISETTGHIGNLDALYINTDKKICRFRHPGECVESYMLRTQTSIESMKELKVRVEENTSTDIIKYIVETSKQIGIEKLILTKKKIGL